MDATKNTYFAVHGQGVIWGVGHTQAEAVAEADKWVNQDRDPKSPSIHELLAESQGYRVGDGWAVLPCTKAAFEKLQTNGGQIGLTIENDTIMLDEESE